MCHPSIVPFYPLYRIVNPRFIRLILLVAPPVGVPALTYSYYRPRLEFLMLLSPLSSDSVCLMLGIWWPLPG